MRDLRRFVLGVSLAGLLVLSPIKKSFGPWIQTNQFYSENHQRLLDSLETRPVEARMSGVSSYKPYRRTPRPVALSREGHVLSPARSEAAPTEFSSGLSVSKDIVAAIRKANGRKASPEAQAELAILNLIEGRLDVAVRLLREAQARKPDDPRLLNDLAAASVALSQETGDPWLALEAIEAAHQSLRLEASRPALFNLALALERWNLSSRASAAWRRYLEEDSRSAWAEEAMQRLDRLEQEASDDRAIARAGLNFPALPQNPFATRQRGERMLLTRWAEQTLAGRESEAEAALAEAETLASTLPAAGGRLLAASAAVIREAEQSGDRARIARLARGHHGFARALSLARQEQKVAAFSVIDSAIPDLRAAESPFELRARLLRALCAAEPDWAELQQLDRAAEEQGFPSIAAEARFIAAYRISLEGRLEAAVDAYQDARKRFEELNEREMSAVMAVMLAELLDTLGREQESGNELAAALAAGPWVADPWNRYSIYVVAASTAAARFSRAAVELRLEAADACRDLPEKPLCAVDSWLWVAALTRDADIAEDALHRAEELLLTAPDSDGKTRTRIDLAAARAKWLAKDDRSIADWEEAAELYRDAAASYEKRGRAPSAARARADRARILHRLGRSEEAAAEYWFGLEAFRRWDERDRILPGSAERRSPRELREVYEKLIDIELDKDRGGPSAAAFLLSEEMRDRLAPRRPETAELWLPGEDDMNRFTAAVPPGTALIEYAIFGERAIAWILAGGPLDQLILAPREQFGKRIRSLTQESSPEAWKRNSGTLFQDLLAPVLERLPAGTERLVLVPDSELYGLPFRALWDPASGRYLDEVLTIELAPSVRQFLGFGERRLPVPAQREVSVLSLGFSTFDPSLGLDPLQWANKEADAVREIYGGATSKDCSGADWAGFRLCAPQAGVLHLATHASADSTRSDWTWLAFERETVSLDRLWRELPDLPQRPLVVLSACQSVAASSGGEGLGGLARPFLASGAQAVVGTLWRIPDREAARFFPEFHRAYRESGDPADALRKARESLEDWEERPWTWGAVEAVAGGH